MGRAKQTVVIGGETLLERAVRVAVEAGLEPVIVVVRDLGVASVLGNCEVVVREGALAKGLRGCEVVVNALADEGMAASIRCGMSARACLTMPTNLRTNSRIRWVCRRRMASCGINAPPIPRAVAPARMKSAAVS